MKVLYLDTFAGISGDMFLGLLVDLGLPLATLKQGLQALSLEGWQLATERQQRLAISGTRALVVCNEGHHHRTWLDIDRLLEGAPLDEQVKALARRIFRRLGEAEARVHGVPLEKVHFHEVGSLDAIVDIVGAAIGLIHLGIDQVLAAPLPLSSGMVATAHGPYPLPAPAVAVLLEGLPVRDAACDKELVTPTGAAIAVSTARFEALPAMQLERVGYGVGSRELPDRPNLLRGLLGTTPNSSGLERDEVVMLETHIDDANPEWLGALLQRLLEQGALDAAIAPLQMKKNRPGSHLSVVAPPERASELARLILFESSATGVRFSRCERLKFQRRAERVRTSLGDIEVKLFFDGEKLIRVTPEFESCQQLARATGRPLPEIYRLAEREAEQFFHPGA